MIDEINDHNKGAIVDITRSFLTCLTILLDIDRIESRIARLSPVHRHISSKAELVQHICEILTQDSFHKFRSHIKKFMSAEDSLLFQARAEEAQTLISNSSWYFIRPRSRTENLTLELIDTIKWCEPGFMKQLVDLINQQDTDTVAKCTKLLDVLAKKTSHHHHTHGHDTYGHRDSTSSSDSEKSNERDRCKRCVLM